MKERPNLNELAKEIYEANKKKGFHDKEQSNEHYLCLVISELMEAVEADRKELRAKYEMHNDITHLDDEGYFNEPAFRHCIKDTLEDELADAIIRLLDLAGLRGLEQFDADFGEILIKDQLLTENIIVIIDILRDKRFELYLNIECAINNIGLLCQHLNIDIWRHVELKIMYNATRERLHGKKY